jgi:hypothetical protein
MSRARPAMVLGALALFALAACTQHGAAGGGAASSSWQSLRGAPAQPVLAGLGTPDSVEQQGDARVYLYRRYRVNRESAAPAPVMTPQGQIITPRPATPVELCETRIRVDAAGRIADIAQGGGACADLMPPPT